MRRTRGMIKRQLNRHADRRRLAKGLELEILDVLNKDLGLQNNPIKFLTHARAERFAERCDQATREKCRSWIVMTGGDLPQPQKGR